MGDMTVEIRCADCGYYDVEWMYSCGIHGTQYCRSCECPYCLEADEDYINDSNECWNCHGERYIGHDCGEDTCCCLDPENNVMCDVCKGKGYLSLPPQETGEPQ